MNTTDSAVRITHIPTGVVVQQQDEKSQHKNKAKALKVLRSRVHDLERAKKDAERAQDRKGQVGSGDRSEKIRTYNYKDNRTTDHRLGRNFSLEPVLEGQLEDLIGACTAEEQRRKLEELSKQDEN